MSNHEIFNVPKVDEFSSNELSYQPSTVGTVFVMGRQRFFIENGTVFGRLTVVSCVGSIKDHIRFNCKCECGVLVIKTSGDLRSGKIRSCGCLQSELTSKRNFKHGMTTRGEKYPPEYHVWSGIKSRCYNKNEIGYPNYGGRGIKVCDRWLEGFENFLADMGPRPSSKHSIDRKDNDGNYEPSNCRWATRLEQSRNQRSNVFVIFKGKSIKLVDLVSQSPVSLKTLRARIFRYKWSVERALSTPKKHN